MKSILFIFVRTPTGVCYTLAILAGIYAHLAGV